MEKLRLLWVSDAPALNTGFAKVTRELLARFSADERYEVASFAWFENPDAVTNLPYPVFAADSEYGQNNFQEVTASFQPDVVVTLGDVWMVDWIVETAGRKDFAWIGYVPIEGAPLPRSWVDVLVEMDAVVAMSRFGQSTIQTAARHLQPSYIPWGVDTNVFRPLPNRAQLRAENGLTDRFVIGCVARNQPRKQYPLLLQAFAEFLNTCPEGLLYLHTDPNDTLGWDLEDLIERFHLSDAVGISEQATVAQGVNEAELNQIYNCFDIFVLPTLAEGFGLPFIESLAAGIPVVATDCSSCPELVEGHGELIQVKARLTTVPYGIEYAFADAAHLVEILKMLNQDLPLRVKYRNEGHAFAQEFAWDDLMEKWHGLLAPWLPRSQKGFPQEDPRAQSRLNLRLGFS